VLSILVLNLNFVITIHIAITVSPVTEITSVSSNLQQESSAMADC